MSHPDQWFGDKTYSQHGEDLVIVNIFKLIGINKPSYLDVGAHHPYNISNTALLYERGSTGICVEANPNLIEEFKKARPRDIIVNRGVGTKRGMKTFYMIDSRSGRNSFQKDEVDRFVKEHPEHQVRQTVDVEVVTLDQLASLNQTQDFPDFLSLDVEGMDQQIIESHDFTYGPEVICVEARTVKESEAIISRLEKFHYFPLIRMISNLILVRDAHFESLTVFSDKLV